MGLNDGGMRQEQPFDVFFYMVLRTLGVINVADLEQHYQQRGEGVNFADQIYVTAHDDLHQNHFSSRGEARDSAM
jgi:hypothetical protein